VLPRWTDLHLKWLWTHWETMSTGAAIEEIYIRLSQSLLRARESIIAPSRQCDYICPGNCSGISLCTMYQSDRQFSTTFQWWKGSSSKNRNELSLWVEFWFEKKHFGLWINGTKFMNWINWFVENIWNKNLSGSWVYGRPRIKIQPIIHA